MEELPDFVISKNSMKNKDLRDYDLEPLYKNFSLESLEKVLRNTLLLFKEGKDTKKGDPDKSIIKFTLCLNILEILLDLCDINANYLLNNGK